MSSSQFTSLSQRVAAIPHEVRPHCADACYMVVVELDPPAWRCARCLRYDRSRQLDLVSYLLDAESERAYRASGDCMCAPCGQPYNTHPFTEHRSFDGQPFLHKLCNGDIVKL